MEGYAKLALLFNEFPDLTCLRRFSEIHTELLLYKQAELCHIEQEIKALREDEPKDSARQWKKWNFDTKDEDALKKQKLFESLDIKLQSYRVYCYVEPRNSDTDCSCRGGYTESCSSIRRETAVETLNRERGKLACAEGWRRWISESCRGNAVESKIPERPNFGGTTARQTRSVLRINIGISLALGGR